MQSPWATVPDLSPPFLPEPIAPELPMPAWHKTPESWPASAAAIARKAAGNAGPTAHRASTEPPRRRTAPPRSPDQPSHPSELSSRSPERASRPSPEHSPGNREAELINKSSLAFSTSPWTQLGPSHAAMLVLGMIMGRMPSLAALFLLGGAAAAFMWLQSRPEQDPSEPPKPTENPSLSKPARPSVQAPDGDRAVRPIERRRRRVTRTVGEEYAFRPYD